MATTLDPETRERLKADTEARRRELGLNPDGTHPDTPTAGTGLAARIEAVRAKAASAPKPDPAIDRERAEAEEADQARQADARWVRAVPVRFAAATVADLDGKLAGLAHWDHTSNVLLVGNVGAGKTHAAVAAARLAHDEGAGVSFDPVVELLDRLRPDGDPYAMDRATSVDVLILDDLGLERPSDWTFERLYAIVNRRWLERRPTIVTSNLPVGELETAVGRPMWSRLYHDALRFTVGGADRRKP